MSHVHDGSGVEEKLGRIDSMLERTG